MDKHLSAPLEEAKVYRRAAEACLRRRNCGRYPELDGDQGKYEKDLFHDFNDAFGHDGVFSSLRPRDICLMLYFMAAMVERP